jgi:hypothetical protein
MANPLAGRDSERSAIYRGARVRVCVKTPDLLRLLTRAVLHVYQTEPSVRERSKSETPL